MKSKKKTAPKRKTIERTKLARLAFCNSARLPQTVDLEGRRMHWVGIGWIDEGPADGTEVLVVES